MRPRIHRNFGPWGDLEMATDDKPLAGLTPVGTSNESDEEPYIKVRSVWKVFGKDPEKVLNP